MNPQDLSTYIKDRMTSLGSILSRTKMRDLVMNPAEDKNRNILSYSFTSRNNKVFLLVRFIMDKGVWKCILSCPAPQAKYEMSTLQSIFLIIKALNTLMHNKVLEEEFMIQGAKTTPIAYFSLNNPILVNSTGRDIFNQIKDGSTYRDMENDLKKLFG